MMNFKTNKLFAVAALMLAATLSAPHTASATSLSVSDYGYGLFGSTLSSPIALVSFTTTFKKFETANVTDGFGHFVVNAGACVQAGCVGVNQFATGPLDGNDTFVYSDAEDLHFLNYTANGVQLLQISPTINNITYVGGRPIDTFDLFLNGVITERAIINDFQIIDTSNSNVLFNSDALGLLAQMPAPNTVFILANGDILTLNKVTQTSHSFQVEAINLTDANGGFIASVASDKLGFAPEPGTFALALLGFGLTLVVVRMRESSANI